MIVVIWWLSVILGLRYDSEVDGDGDGDGDGDITITITRGSSK